MPRIHQRIEPAAPAPPHRGRGKPDELTVASSDQLHRLCPDVSSKVCDKLVRALVFVMAPVSTDNKYRWKLPMGQLQNPGHSVEVALLVRERSFRPYGWQLVEPAYQTDDAKFDPDHGIIRCLFSAEHYQQIADLPKLLKIKRNPGTVRVSLYAPTLQLSSQSKHAILRTAVDAYVWGARIDGDKIEKAAQTMANKLHCVPPFVRLLQNITGVDFKYTLARNGYEDAATAKKIKAGDRLRPKRGPPKTCRVARVSECTKLVAIDGRDTMVPLTNFYFLNPDQELYPAVECDALELAGSCLGYLVAGAGLGRRRPVMATRKDEGPLPTNAVQISRGRCTIILALLFDMKVKTPGSCTIKPGQPSSQFEIVYKGALPLFNRVSWAALLGMKMTQMAGAEALQEYIAAVARRGQVLDQYDARTGEEQYVQKSVDSAMRGRQHKVSEFSEEHVQPQCIANVHVELGADNIDMKNDLRWQLGKTLAEAAVLWKVPISVVASQLLELMEGSAKNKHRVPVMLQSLQNYEERFKNRDASLKRWPCLKMTQYGPFSCPYPREGRLQLCAKHLGIAAPKEREAFAVTPAMQMTSKKLEVDAPAPDKKRKVAKSPPSRKRPAEP